MDDLIDRFNAEKEAIEQLFREKKDKQTIFLRIANMILEVTDVLTLDDTDQIYVYNEFTGDWEKSGELTLKDQIFKIYPLLSKSDMEEVIAKIKYQTHFPRDNLNPPHLLGLKNKTYNFTIESTGDHYPENYLTRSINVFYDKNAECPEFLKFLYDVVGPEQIDLIFEIIGYCLLPGYPYHKAFMFIGGGANGKSTLLQVIEQFLGGNNVSHISLQDFERQFSANRLFGRMANISADLPSKPVRHTGIFKQLTGGDTIWADIKYHKDGISFINQAKMFFSMNKPPPFLYDDSDAVWRRIMIIDFPNHFSGESCDRQIISKLTRDSELSGIFNLALGALSRLSERGGFEEIIDETRRDYIHLSNSIQAFAEEMLVEDLQGQIPYEDLYKEYSWYCHKTGLLVESKTMVTKRLPRYIASAEKVRLSYNKFEWSGITWK